MKTKGLKTIRKTYPRVISISGLSKTDFNITASILPRKQGKSEDATEQDDWVETKAARYIKRQT